MELDGLSLMLVTMKDYEPGVWATGLGVRQCAGNNSTRQVTKHT